MYTISINPDLCYGILLQVPDSKTSKSEFETLWRQTKEGLVTLIETSSELGDSPALTIRMPCGESMKCEKPEDIPCSCGNPKHWFVKFRIVE